MRLVAVWQPTDSDLGRDQHEHASANPVLSQISASKKHAPIFGDSPQHESGADVALWCPAMTATSFDFVLLTVCGWINRRQLLAIEYLREENRVLRERLEQAPLPLRRAAPKACGER